MLEKEIVWRNKNKSKNETAPLHPVIYSVYACTITGDPPPLAHLRIIRQWIKSIMAPGDEMEHSGLD